MIKCSEMLKYIFTEEELKSFAQQLARENTGLAEAEEQKKAMTAQFGDKIASAKSKISTLARYINSGYEYRSIDCEVKLHTPEVGSKTIFRIDTGEEVKTLPMTQSELQEELPLSEAK